MSGSYLGRRRLHHARVGDVRGLVGGRGVARLLGRVHVGRHGGHGRVGQVRRGWTLCDKEVGREGRLAWNLGWNGVVYRGNGVCEG